MVHKITKSERAHNFLKDEAIKKTYVYDDGTFKVEKLPIEEIAEPEEEGASAKLTQIIELLIPFLSGADISEMKSFLVSNISKGKVADLELVDEFIVENS